MTQDDLTITQARELWHVLSTMTGYLRRLHNRMDQLRFAKNDELYVLVTNAYRAVERLTVKAQTMGPL
jgi:phage anti-repressor protein